MGEIDTKPIEPVQVALTLFGQKGDQRRSNTSSEEMERDKDIEILLREMANYKVQLDAKDSAYLQLQFNLEHYRKKSEEISTALLDRDACTDALRCARWRVRELESKVKDMESELAAAREEKVKALTQAELMETAATVEKERAEELLQHVNEQAESIFKLKLAVEQAEKEKSTAVSKKDAEMKKQLEMVEELENLLLAKSAYIDSLRKEINKANKKLDSSDRDNCVEMEHRDQPKADVKGEEAENSNQELYDGAFGTELNRLKLELLNANDEVIRLSREVEMLTDELEKVKTEMNEIKVRENEAEVKMALLKSELHKGRSELVAAKAAEARAVSAKSGLYLAVQQLALEAEEAKKENQRLKQGADKANEESYGFGLVGSQCKNPYQLVEESQTKSKAEAEERPSEKDGKITISLEEYECLTKNAEKANPCVLKHSTKLTASDGNRELANLKKELEAAMAKIAELRNRTEQAVSRAEAAEKAKMSLEDQLRAWQDRRQRRKAALAALREESSSGLYSPDTYSDHLNKYEPLGKVLNIEF